MKKYDVYLMPDAIKDLENIYDYITEESGFPEDYEAIMSPFKTE